MGGEDCHVPNLGPKENKPMSPRKNLEKILMVTNKEKIISLGKLASNIIKAQKIIIIG